MTLKDHLRSLGDKEFLEELANSEPRPKPEVAEGESKKTEDQKVAPSAEELVTQSEPIAVPKPLIKRASPERSEPGTSSNDVIVSVTADGRAAKGFVVDTNGTILTNLHLVRSAKKIRVEFVSGDVFLGRVSKEDQRRDLALLKIPGQTPIFAQLGSTTGLDVGDPVLILPKGTGAHSQMVQATVCALRTLDGTSYVQVDQALANQDSGSPVMDREGRILGISNVRAGDSTPDVAFAVSVTELKSFISGQ